MSAPQIMSPPTPARAVETSLQHHHHHHHLDHRNRPQDLHLHDLSHPQGQPELARPLSHSESLDSKLHLDYPSYSDSSRKTSVGSHTDREKAASDASPTSSSVSEHALNDTDASPRLAKPPRAALLLTRDDSPYSTHDVLKASQPPYNNSFIVPYSAWHWPYVGTLPSPHLPAPSPSHTHASTSPTQYIRADGSVVDLSIASRRTSTMLGAPLSTTHPSSSPFVVKPPQAVHGDVEMGEKVDAHIPASRRHSRDIKSPTQATHREHNTEKRGSVLSSHPSSVRASRSPTVHHIPPAMVESEDENGARDKKQTAKALLILSTCVPLTSLAFAFYTLAMLLGLTLMSPIRCLTCPAYTLQNHLVYLLAPSLRFHLRTVTAAPLPHSTIDHNIRLSSLVLVLLGAPIVSSGLAVAGWIVAGFWVLNATIMETESGIDDGMMLAEKVVRLWEAWLMRPLRPEV